MAAEKMKNTGFTIIELMVAAIIGILAIMVLFTVSFTIQDNMGITVGVLDISQKGRLAINHISRDTREAKSVVSSYGGYATSDTVIVLRVPSIDASGDIIDPETYFDMIIYTLDSVDPEQLRRIVDADAVSSRTDTSEVITGDIDTLLFSSQGTGLSSVSNKTALKTVTAKIITRSAPLGFDRTNEITTSVSLRNKEIGL